MVRWGGVVREGRAKHHNAEWVDGGWFAGGMATMMLHLLPPIVQLLHPLADWAGCPMIAVTKPKNKLLEEMP